MAEQKKLTPLERVQAKAVYNYHKRLREQEEERAFKQQLEAGIFPGAPVQQTEDKKGKK